MKVILFFVLAIVCPSIALECYSCTTLAGLNPYCQTDFRYDTISCDIYDYNDPRCAVSNIINNGEVTLFTRACIDRSWCDAYEGSQTAGDLTVYNTCCNTDFCNDGMSSGGGNNGGHDDGNRYYWNSATIISENYKLSGMILLLMRFIF
ncbi:uncharacterized protein LOC102808310 [Saccoglossus kowalevskii]